MFSRSPARADYGAIFLPLGLLPFLIQTINFEKREKKTLIMATRESPSDSSDSDDGLTETTVDKPQQSAARKKKRYSQTFRPEWLADKDFKDWLARDTTGSVYCKWCNCGFQAKLSVLKTHANSRRHKNLASVSSGSNKVRDIKLWVNIEQAGSHNTSMAILEKGDLNFVKNTISSNITVCSLFYNN